MIESIIFLFSSGVTVFCPVKTKNENIITTVSGGDPGYGETAKFISEMALTIILNPLLK